MSRYIDADAIISFVDAGHLRNPMELSWSDKDVVDMIESIPTVDAVQVVRCKNCIACRKQDDYEYWCAAQSHAYLVAKDGFCSRGNRVECSNVVCGYCQDGRCYNDHETKVVHVCPRGYGKENDT